MKMLSLEQVGTHELASPPPVQEAPLSSATRFTKVGESIASLCSRERRSASAYPQPVIDLVVRGDFGVQKG